MNMKEQVLKSLNHEQPDRIPVDFGSTAVTGMHVKQVDALRKYYNLEKKLVKVHEPYQMLGLIEEDLQEKIGIDAIGTGGLETIFGFKNENWKKGEMHDGLDVLVSEHFKIKKDENGASYIYPKGDTSAPPSGKMPKDGYFFDSIIRQSQPIDDNNLDVQDNLEEFNYFTEEDIQHFQVEAKKAYNTGKCVVISPGGTALGDIALVPAPFLKYPKGIRDVEEWYMSTLIRQDYIHSIFERQVEIALHNLYKLNQAVGQYIDVVFICGTDFGTQDSQFCDVDTFRSLYFPYYKKMNDWIHQNTNWKTFKHSCGSVRGLIPSFIECGFDILNPVQISATNMDPRDLKDEFGQEITFWGGGVDTQHELMFGKPEEVRNQVLKTCKIFGEDGGFVFNAIHNVQANAPLENVVAMINAVHEFNGEKI